MDKETQTGASILIVDDDEHICKSLQVILQKKGHGTSVAHSGKDALRKLRECFYDLVLLDVRLPDMPGLALMAPLKERHPDAKVVVITAFGSLETARLAVRRGAVGYIAKPFGMEEVWNTVSDALSPKRGENKER
jgi:DNA-binding NtrC family response regulator